MGIEYWFAFCVFTLFGGVVIWALWILSSRTGRVAGFSLGALLIIVGVLFLVSGVQAKQKETRWQENLLPSQKQMLSYNRNRVARFCDAGCIVHRTGQGFEFVVVRSSERLVKKLGTAFEWGNNSVFEYDQWLLSIDEVITPNSLNWDEASGMVLRQVLLFFQKKPEADAPKIP